MALHTTGCQLSQLRVSSLAGLEKLDLQTASVPGHFRNQFLNRSSHLSSSSLRQNKLDNWQRRRGQCVAEVFKVELEYEGGVKILDVPDDETILDVALDSGLELSHDCKLGVCMTCPAKLETGEVDQSGGMLSDDVAEKGYTLLCISYPRSDCKVRVIPEEELLSLQLATAND